MLAFSIKKRIGIIALSFLTFMEAKAQKDYFQQEVNYAIQVKLNDIKHELTAFESIEYINHSKDSLKEIHFHLWPNAYKNERTAMAKQFLINGSSEFYFSKEKDRGFIDSLDFKVDGIPCRFIYDDLNIDLGKLILNDPLPPEKKINISTPFRVKIPNAKFSRLGHIDNAYMISQWFPKPAVYDKNGWHPIPYLTQGEFYSEFGSFDVKITLPKNYIVGSTGYLQDSSEIVWLNEIAKKTEGIVSFDEKKDSTIVSDSSYKTLQYTANQVHDFAWFANKKFHVLKAEVELPKSKRIVTTWTLFTNSKANTWKNGPQYIKQTLLSYSDWLGEYPYNQVTIVDATIAAGGGMEYPMVTAIGKPRSDSDLEFTVLHEVGHNWFYGILASNERENGWMDEGMNTCYNLRFFNQKDQNKSFADAYLGNGVIKLLNLEKYPDKTQYILGYWLSARKNNDQPCTITSEDFTNMNYGTIMYFKTGFAFNYLLNYLGETKFDSAMKNYYSNWSFRHPQPADLKKSFTDVADTNLDWFFDDVLASTKKMNYSILKLKQDDSLYYLCIKNKTSLIAPFNIDAVKNDSIVKTQWYGGFNGFQKIKFPKGDYDKLVIDYPWNSLEINRSNNTLKTKGLFKRWEPLQLQFIGTIENGEKSVLNYFPVAGFNTSDKTMVGMAFYNRNLIRKPLEFLVMPMYAFGTKQLNGSAYINYHYYPNSLIKEIQPELQLKKYSYQTIENNLSFYKLSGRVNFYLPKKLDNDRIAQKISFRSAAIAQDQSPYNSETNKYEKKRFARTYLVNNLQYSFNNFRKLQPFDLMIDIEQGEKYLKSSATANFHFNYSDTKKSADIRLFGGRFIYNDVANNAFGFAMSGNNDYAFDNIFLSRYGNDLLGQQLYLKDGGFKNISTVQNAMKWLLSANITLPAPGKIPLAFYTDLGATDSRDGLVYDYGVALIVLKDIFEIYAPIKQSSNLNQLNYGEKIRFVLHLNSLNPFDILNP